MCIYIICIYTCGELDGCGDSGVEHGSEHDRVPLLLVPLLPLFLLPVKQPLLEAPDVHGLQGIGALIIVVGACAGIAIAAGVNHQGCSCSSDSITRTSGGPGCWLDCAAPTGRGALRYEGVQQGEVDGYAGAVQLAHEGREEGPHLRQCGHGPAVDARGDVHPQLPRQVDAGGEYLREIYSNMLI